jgi:hypothetical protein
MIVYAPPQQPTSPGVQVSLGPFLWAISVILSRGVSGPNRPFSLLPFFDFLNHR